MHLRCKVVFKSADVPSLRDEAVALVH
jgi:hypothetical protein